MICCHGATHPGLRRENNEDAFLLLPHLNAAILADGMGGQNCGEVGSALTINGISKYLADPQTRLSLSETALEAIRSANRDVIAAARVQTSCEGMGSTVVLALWTGTEMVLANVGDSRAYLLRAGELTQLSYDQNFANELRNQLGLSEERVRAIPTRHVLTMAVGAFEQVLVRTHVQQLSHGDRILLCSDGLYGPVDHATLTGILNQGGELPMLIDRLIDCANQRGGPDNITAVLLEYIDEAHG